METTENKGFAYEFGEFILDPDGKTLFSGGIPIHLPAKEFETLVLLVENCGVALSKEKMMSSLWNNVYVEESNLARQIWKLRKVLNTEGRQFIETIPKHGYRFTAEVHRLLPGFKAPIILEKHTVRRITVAVEEESPPQPAASWRNSKSFFTMPKLAAIALIGVAVFTTVYLWNQQATRIAGNINSLAVLPLRPLSVDEDTKALGLGLADALIAKIGRIRHLSVRPTDSVALVASDADPVETGRRLKVDVVLTGTIQQAEGRLRVNARLLRTDTGEQLWAETFDESSGRVFTIQDSLSAKIANTLAFELTNSDSTEIYSHSTKSSEAYEKYLRGRFYQSQNTAEGLNRSIEFYEQATALDPAFADAYAGLADANVILFNFGLRPASETIPKARQAVNKAFQLNPDLSSAYSTLALIQFLIDHSWNDAEKSLQRAIALDPNSSDAFLRYGYCLINVNKFDEALEKLEAALGRNPLSPMVRTDIGLANLGAKRYKTAIEQLEKVTAENPDFPLAQWFLAAGYEGVGDEELAFAANMRALELEGGGELAKRLRAVENANGIKAAERAWLDDRLRARESGRASAFDVAWLYAALEDSDNTIEWLEKAIAEGEPAITQINFMSRYDFVRDDPRFKLLQNKLAY